MNVSTYICIAIRTKHLNMKKTSFLWVALMAVLLGFTACDNSGNTTETGDAGDVATGSAESKSYNVDAAASSLEWIGKKVTGQHNGTINLKSGSLSIESGNLTAGNFVIDMTTISVADLEAGQGKEDLEAHLMGTVEGKEGDFFNVQSYPESKFEITGVEAVTEEGITHHVKGNLTMLEETKEITIPANITIADDNFSAMANFSIDRTEWGIKYGSGKFFDNLGDKTINDEFEMKLNLQAKP